MTEEEIENANGDCDCPHKLWCHTPRQFLQSEWRKRNPKLAIKDCDFYRMIEEKLKQ
ncbi:hypothetical protein ACFFHH_15265 [Cytobacillus solani]|uniref:hypothetical protein n=1 Tax=Cytobacillus solani TaxID=1637975 RepID=UPI000AC12322|nr:hypothetical protein [Cytobacillus solani]USK54223.1 hypothetical protein LIS82_22070 [Cytobacillus solani]